VADIQGEEGKFKVRILKKARFVEEDKCVGCGECAEKCPTKVTDEFNMGLGQRKAIYKYFPQAVPSTYVIDPEHCRLFNGKKCGVCQKTCKAKAVNYEQKDQEIVLDVGAVIMATGFDMYDVSALTEYGWGKIPNVLTAMQFERMICASGPTRGHLNRPSDGKEPKTLAFIQCVGSRDVRHRRYCSAVCCMHATKEAILAHEHYPHLSSTIFFMDMRAVGKGFQDYIQRASSEYAVVAEQMGVSLDEFGFVAPSEDLLNPFATSRGGIFACGFCQSPMDVPDSVVRASGAASKVAEVLASCG
jgi:heterodisulfide reductase subunit A